MASIHREVVLEADPKDVWAAVRDVAAPHKRLAPGFLVDTRLDDGARVVTFANGLVAREIIVDVDDEARRFVWAVSGSSRLTHYNADLLRRGCRRYRRSHRPSHGRDQENAGAVRFPREGRRDGTESAH